MLSRYDEFPVHQSSRPFAHIPVTDSSWDEGYYFAFFNAEEKVFVLTGMRVNPNTDMIGGYAIINVAGQQYSVRFSRCWRREMDTVIGPLRYEFVEPLKSIRLTLEPNDSGLTFDVLWEGVSPAFEEAHHTAETRGRTTTDQTRYSQAGVADGHVELKGRRYEVQPDRWSAVRDHSWGLYKDRKPLGGHAEWLPPNNVTGPTRAMRLWVLFTAGEWSGFYHLHESADGEQVEMNDVFGSPFEGRFFNGWDGPSVRLTAASHQLEFTPGTRILKRASIFLTDEHGRDWTQHFEVACPPWVPLTMGYTLGSWKDGGTMHTYHGSEELAMEWDEFDFSEQPFTYTPYAPAKGVGATQAEVLSSFGLGSGDAHGTEFLVTTELIDPDGNRHTGQGHFENYIHGRYAPYGFE